MVICAFMLAADSARAANAAVSDPESVLTLQASQLAVNGEYGRAIGIYSQLIQIDAHDADHYIQRALLYRQIKKQQQSEQDAAMALRIADKKLQKPSKRKISAKYYWQRAQANRLLKNFKAAEADLTQAIRLRGDQKYAADMQAIVLESKIYAAGR